MLDFGARFYDPATAIFLQHDPLAEKYYNLSPYAYCATNPVNFVDPDGEAWVKVGKTTAKAAYKAIKAGRKISVKGVVKSAVFDIIDDVNTLFDQNGIPRSQQPNKTIKPNTKLGDAEGLRDDNIVQYQFTDSKGEKITIRKDKAIAYPDGGYQPSHYNAGKTSDNKLKQHHYYE